MHSIVYHPQALFLVLAGIFLNCEGAVIKRGAEALSGKNAGWTYDGNLEIGLENLIIFPNLFKKN